MYLLHAKCVKLKRNLDFQQGAWLVFHLEKAPKSRDFLIKIMKGNFLFFSRSPLSSPLLLILLFISPTLVFSAQPDSQVTSQSPGSWLGSHALVWSGNGVIFAGSLQILFWYNVEKYLFLCSPLFRVSAWLKFLIWKVSIIPSCWQITGVKFSAWFELAGEKEVNNLLNVHQ